MDLSDRFLPLMGEALRLAETQEGLALPLDKIQSRLVALAEEERSLQWPSVDVAVEAPALPAPQIPQGDLEFARFAVYAWVDEKLFSSPRPDASSWIPRSLQSRYFHTSEAGRLFYTRMRELMNFSNLSDSEEDFDLAQRLESSSRLVDSSAHGEAIRIYALCLLYGFRGQYFGNPEYLSQLRVASKSLLKDRVFERERPKSKPAAKDAAEKISLASFESIIYIVLPLFVCVLFGFFCASILADIPLKSF